VRVDDDVECSLISQKAGGVKRVVYSALILERKHGWSDHCYNGQD
jgi:hypothetical protein